MRCGGLLPLLASFIIALNIMQTDSSKQNHQLKEWIKDKKESLRKVFSDLFSKKEGKGDGEGKLILVYFGIKTLLA